MRFLLFLTIFFYSEPSFCLEKKSGTEVKNYTNFLPAVIYTPETLLGIGGYFRVVRNYSFVLDNTSMQLFTMNKQVMFHNILKLNNLTNTLSIWSFLEIEKNPLIFFGDSPKSKLSEGNEFTPFTFSLAPDFLFKSQENFYILLKPSIRFDEFLSFDTSFPEIEKWKSREGITSGIGIGFLYDSRNSVDIPSIGNYLTASYELLHNDEPFHRFTFDERSFNPISSKVIWAARLYAVQCIGNVPPYILPYLGGAKIMRGFRKLRFSDKFIATLDNELRIDVHQAVDIVPFVIAGSLADSIHRVEEPLLTAGGGLRFKIPPQYLSVVRLDTGYSKDGLQVYFYANHAF